MLPDDDDMAALDLIVRAHLMAFEQGDFESWGAKMLSTVFMMAADPAEVFTGRQAALDEMHKDFDEAFAEGMQLSIWPQGIYLGVSPDRQMAWSAAPLDYSVVFGEEVLPFHLRETNIFYRQSNQWSVAAAHYSRGLPAQEIWQGFTNGRFPAPHPVGDRIDPDAELLVVHFEQHLADLTLLPVAVNAYLFGPQEGDQADGAAAVQELLAEMAHRYGALRLRSDGLRASLASGGRAGWIAANVESSVAGVPYVFRLLAAYAAGEAGWELVQAHLSVGVPDPDV
jgi:hypothetical protein